KMSCRSWTVVNRVESTPTRITSSSGGIGPITEGEESMAFSVTRPRERPTCQAPGVRAVVTGGAGFIGSHLVDALVAAGDEVTVVDHLQRAGKRPLPAGVKVVREDVTELAGVAAAFRDARPSVVYHLAAQIDVRRSVAEPALDAHVNVGGTAVVLTAALDAGAAGVRLAPPR